MIEHIKESSQVLASLEYLKGLKIVGLDTETNSLNPLVGDLLLLQIGDGYRQFVYDVHKLGKAITPLLNFLRDNLELIIIAHNMKFDYNFIHAALGLKLNKVACTMIMEQLLNQGKVNVEANLEAVVDKYLGIKLDKTEQANFQNLPVGYDYSKKQIDYAGNDVRYLIPLYQKLNSLLITRNMEILGKLENETVKVTGDLEYDGIYINKDKWLLLKSIEEEKAVLAKKDLDTHFSPHCQTDLFGDPVINYKSNPQVGKVLSKICATKFKSVAEPVLKIYQNKYPAVASLLNYRKAIKRVDTYGQSFIDQHVFSDQRIHSSFYQLGAETGRFSSKRPNMTNIPKEQEYRDPFEAQGQDYLMISADFSGQELRLLVELSKEPKLIEALEKQMDLHSYSASLLNDIPYDDFLEKDASGNVVMEDGAPKIKADMKKNYRGPTKSCTFGIIYGAGPTKLASQLNIEVNTAKQLMKKYFETFPGIKTLMDELVEEAKENKYALSPLDGRRRDLSSVDWDNSRKEAHAMNIAKNLPFQGAGASITKYAACKIRNSITIGGYDAKLINIIHDEVLVEVHKEHAEEVSEIVKNDMIAAFNYYAPNVPMEVAPSIAKHWVH